MGGSGSGRPSYKQKAEECRSLDVSVMNRKGCLNAGSAGYWAWRLDDEVIAQIGFRAEKHCVIFDYRVRINGGDWERITQSVPLTYVGCYYGGQRPYFSCPGFVDGKCCGRRVGKLFLGGRYFLCRHCHSISYTSQSEERHYRLMRRANKLRMALGGEPGAAHLIARKPKGMWQRTYERKRHEINWRENEADRYFLEKFAHRLSKEDRKLIFGQR